MLEFPDFFSPLHSRLSIRSFVVARIEPRINHPVLWAVKAKIVGRNAVKHKAWHRHSEKCRFFPDANRRTVDKCSFDTRSRTTRFMMARPISISVIPRLYCRTFGIRGFAMTSRNGLCTIGIRGICVNPDLLLWCAVPTSGLDAIPTKGRT